MDALWSVLISILTALAGYIILIIKSNAKGIISMEERLVKVEKSEQECQENYKELKRQSFQQELESSRQKEEISRLIRLNSTLTASSFVTAKSDGIILDASENIFELLGWHNYELINKNVEIIIPDEYRERHERGLENLKNTGHLRPYSAVLSTFALHKNGAKIAVNITLNEKNKEPFTVVAQINRRIAN